MKFVLGVCNTHHTHSCIIYDDDDEERRGRKKQEEKKNRKRYDQPMYCSSGNDHIYIVHGYLKVSFFPKGRIPAER